MHPIERLWWNARSDGGQKRERHASHTPPHSGAARRVRRDARQMAVDAARGHCDMVVLESAALLCDLVLLWAELGISPQQVWAAIEARPTPVDEPLPGEILPLRGPQTLRG